MYHLGEMVRFATPPFTLIMLLLAIALGGCGDDSPPGPNHGLPEIDVRYDGGTLRAEVATTADQRSIGLSGRDALDADAGMLFVYDEPATPSFWMRNTLIPLDLIWIGDGGRIVDITPDVPTEIGVADGELRRYSPDAPVLSVLELNAGTAERLGLAVGDALAFETTVR